MKKYRTEILLVMIGIVLTLIAREHAVNHRLSLGLEPSWGGEFMIMPLIGLLYAAFKADWSID